jgi:hypothetical protein
VRYDKKMYIGLHVKYRYSCPSLTKLELSRQIFGKKNPQISSFMKICPVGDGFLHADGSTGQT